MPRAQRTTKSVARRIDLSYFKRPHPLRTWRFVLSILAPVAALVWLATYGVARNNYVYTSGKMAPAHAVLAQRCFTCHITRAASFRETALDRGCLSCHDGPIHHSNQTFTPSCASCHVEHRGQLRLASTANESCTQCHANLETAGTPTPYVRHITGFGSGHPEFAALRPGFSDPGTIKLNHAVHLKAGLKGPHGEPVQLDCEDCHRANQENQSWPYAIAPGSLAGETPQAATGGVAPVSFVNALPPSTHPTRAYMGPILYARQCAGCHPLLFDKRFAESAPHDKPEIVQTYIERRFRDYIAAHPEELREPVLRIALPAKPVPVSPRIYKTPEEWVNAKVADAELLLWEKTCKQCHTVMQQETGLPRIAESRITPRWFQHAVFDHNQHRLVTCESCHTRSRTSQNTSDVLLPGIRICEQCHHTGAAGAESRCFECHTYHNWRLQKEVTSHFRLADLANEGGPRIPQMDGSSGAAK